MADNTPRKIVSPEEAQAAQVAKLQAKLDEMSSSPWLDLVTEHIRAHDEELEAIEPANRADDAKPLGWVLEQITSSEDLLCRKSSILVAAKVFFAISLEVTKELVPLAVAELEARLDAVRKHSAVATLDGKVMTIIADPGDLSRAEKRFSLDWALGVAETKLGEDVDLDAIVSLMTEVMGHVRPWFEYGWDAMLESHEEKLVEDTAKKGRPYKPFKVEAIQQALDTLEADDAEGNQNFRALLAPAGKRKGLILAVDGFAKTLTHNGQLLFDGDFTTKERFEELLQTVKPSAGKPSNRVVSRVEFRGSGSRSNASKKRSTAKSAEEKAEVATRTVEKPYAETKRPNPQGPEDPKAQAVRGKPIAGAGLTAKQRNTRGKKG